MKKYMIITPWCPYPPYKNGGVHTVYNILKNVNTDVKLDLFYYSERDMNAEKVIKEYVGNIYHKNLKKTRSRFNRIVTYVNQLPDFFSDLDMNSIQEAFSFKGYDAVILDQFISLPFTEAVPDDIPVIAMMHDNNILLYQRKARQDHLIKKYYDNKQCQYLLNTESRFFHRIKKIIFVSKLDAVLCADMHKEYEGEIDYIQLGVDIPDISRISTDKSIHSMVFSGVMDYGPNEDAAVYFAKEIFPKLKKEYHDAKFIIAGKNPSRLVKKLASRDVLVTGFVEDMVKVITKSQIYVSPLRYGSGTKNKVLEAMAAGLPVFASEVSREGISGLVDRQNCFFINDDNIINVISEAMENVRLLEKIAENGRRFVEQNHSWKNVFDKFI